MWSPVRTNYRESFSSQCYYHTNSIGTVVALTDASGGVVERYEYGHFGELEKVTSGDGTTEHTKDGKPYSPTGNEYFFQGRRLDPETGLYYFRARYYNAAVGRFLSRDPLLYVDGMNPYQAFGGNPVNILKVDRYLLSLPLSCSV